MPNAQRTDGVQEEFLHVKSQSLSCGGILTMYLRHVYLKERTEEKFLSDINVPVRNPEVSLGRPVSKSRNNQSSVHSLQPPSTYTLNLLFLIFQNCVGGG